MKRTVLLLAHKQQQQQMLFWSSGVVKDANWMRSIGGWRVQRLNGWEHAVVEDIVNMVTKMEHVPPH